MSLHDWTKKYSLARHISFDFNFHPIIRKNLLNDKTFLKKYQNYIKKLRFFNL